MVRTGDREGTAFKRMTCGWRRRACATGKASGRSAVGHRGKELSLRLAFAITATLEDARLPQVVWCKPRPLLCLASGDKRLGVLTMDWLVCIRKRHVRTGDLLTYLWNSGLWEDRPFCSTKFRAKAPAYRNGSEFGLSAPVTQRPKARDQRGRGGHFQNS